MNTAPRQDETGEHYREREDIEEGVSEATDLALIVTAEINQQIATAKRFPRSVTQFRKDTFELVTLDTDIAQSCIYALPRGKNKIIEGPSIRFAEVILSTWGNSRAAMAIAGIDQENVRGEGMFLDLEKNVAIKAEVMRRITNREGERFNADMIQQTGNAASAIALRNAILRGIPKAFWFDMYQAARKLVAGDIKTFVSRRDTAMKELAIMGATPEMIFGMLGIKGIEDLSTDNLVTLRGLQNAIKEGETTLEEAFAPKEGEVVPPRPRKSEFARQQPAQNAGPSNEKAKSNTAPEVRPPGVREGESNGKPPQAQTQESRSAPVQPVGRPDTTAPSNPVQAVQEAEESEQERQARLEEDLDIWLADAEQQLVEITRLRDLAERRDAVAHQLKGDEPRTKQWHASCDRRMKEILESTRKPTARK